ncbi:MAG: PAS domain-containing protein [Syntrophobacterales bacterium]|nr:PAS domain-containing protein [Syntrophobacterales bacterium]
MRPRRLFTQLTLSFLAVAVLGVAAATWISTRIWRHFLLTQTNADLEAQARFLAHIARERWSRPENLDDLCKKVGRATGVRLTLVAADGRVLGDSLRDPAAMENHADRREIQEAVRGRVGVHARLSPTVGLPMTYVAVPITEDGRTIGVARAALPATAMKAPVRQVYLQVLVGALIILGLAAGLSLWLSRRLTRPLEEIRRGAERLGRGNLSLKLPTPEVEELVSLADALNSMAEQLNERITTIQEQRREQEAILASMVEGVLAVDPRGRLLSFNRAAAALLNLAPEMVGRNITEVVRNPDLQWFVTRALAATEPVEGEVTVREDEEERILQAHGTTLRDSRQVVLGVLIVLHDITRLRRLEIARRDFVANVSHELKTPVTSIKGFVETLLEGALQDPQHAEEFLKIISRQVERLHQIIEDLLSLSRIEQEAEQGRIILHGRRLGPVLRAALQACSDRARDKEITLELSCPEDLRARLNDTLLEQALVNLIDNAIKYSGPQSRVQIEAAKEDGWVAVRVRDQGIGIPKEHLPRLFERFYRVDPGRSRKAGGTGLGLAIVKHIAQAHGGKVTVESTPGQGSVFTLLLQPD